MLNYNIGSLHMWQRISAGEVLDLGLPESGYRQVDFDLIADRPVVVRAVTSGEAYPVGFGQGFMSIKFSTMEPVGLCVDGSADAEVFIRTRVQPQVIDESLDPSYTTIEPRPAGPSDEVRRMMLLMRLNMERRVSQLQADLDAARSASVNSASDTVVEVDNDHASE